MNVLRLLFVPALLVSSHLLAGQGKQQASLCGVMEATRAARSPLVSVRASLYSDRHGAFLVDEVERVQPYCRVIPTAVSIRTTQEELVEGELGVDFETDASSARELERLIQESQLNMAVEISAVFIGEIHQRQGFQIFRNSNGAWVGNGFGQAGIFRAQFVVKSVRDTQITKRHRR